MPVKLRIPREPFPLWLAAGPALNALAMALLSSDDRNRSLSSVVLLLASLVLVASILVQRLWPGSRGRGCR